MNYVKVGLISDLTPGSKKKIVLETRVILLVNIDGAYYAIDNKCPHLGGSLYDGTFSADVITCPRHGASFNVKTGKNMGDAKIAFVKMKVKDAKSLPVKVEGEDVLVGME